MNNKPLISPGFIIGFQYFLFFGVLGILLPYFNLYLHHLGFNSFEIGAVSASRSIIVVIFSIIWAVLADRFKIRKPIYIGCNFINAGIWILYFYNTDFNEVLFITILGSIFFAPIISFLEAFAIDTMGDEKKSYGKLRVWGSISFILIVLTIGKTIDTLSTKSILGFVLGGLILLSVLSLKTPWTQHTSDKPFFSDIKKLLKKRSLLFFASAFIMITSHGTYYGFFSIYLENIGYGSVFIGMTWAIAAISEIFVMLKSDKIFKKLALEDILLFSFGAAILRWFMLCLSQATVVILLSQVLNAATYGLFHIASILYIDKLSQDRTKTVAQAVNNAVSYGLGMGAGFFLNGVLYERIGARYLFGLSGIMAVIGGLILFFGIWLHAYKKPRP